MPKPEEVLVVEDENGEVVKEHLKDVEVVALHKTVRETLVYLTHLNHQQTEDVMIEKLGLQVSVCARMLYHACMNFKQSHPLAHCSCVSMSVFMLEASTSTQALRHIRRGRRCIRRRGGRVGRVRACPRSAGRSDPSQERCARTMRSGFWCTSSRISWGCARLLAARYTHSLPACFSSSCSSVILRLGGLY
jgi:hypothetical protein